MQYIEEVTFGTLITASPVYTNAGSIIDVRENLNETVNHYRRLGAETLYKQLETGEMYSFEIVLQPTTSTLMKYGTQAQGGGAGSIDKSLQFVYTEDINDVENYVYFLGCRPDRTSVEITPASVLLTMNFLCREITTPSSTSGLTTPTHAAVDTGTPWVGADGGANPFTHNSLNYDTDKFSFNVQRHLDAIQVNGQTLISFLPPTNKDVSGEFDVIRKNTALMDDRKTLVQRAASYVLKAATSTATFTNMVLESMKAPHSATANSVPRDAFTFTATDVSVS